MSATGLPVFDNTVQQTNLWLKSITTKLGVDDRHLAYSLLKGTLHALRDRIGPENAVHLGAQLPILLRGVYYEGWRPTTTPTRERQVSEFIDHVRRELPKGTHFDIELGVRTVMEVMWEKIDAEEVAKLIRIVPEDLRQLWSKAA